MAEEDKSSKSEKATPKKKRDARKKGQVSKSQDVGVAAGLIAAFGTIMVFNEYLLSHFMQLFHKIYGSELMTNPDELVDHIDEVFLGAMAEVAFISLPIMFAVMIFGFTAQLAQVGFILTTETMKPKLSKINPVKGIKRWFAIKSLVELGKSVAKLGLVFTIGFFAIRSSWESMAVTALMDPSMIVVTGAKLIQKMFFWVLPLLITIATVDAIFQRWQWERDLKMSKKDLKDEYKQQEGDPYMKQSRKQFHQQLSNQQSSEAVPESDVVVINPTQYAVAVKYDPQKNPVPVVQAKGETRHADAIREEARKNGIPIVRNKPLARSLYAQVDVGEAVPGDLYKPVAEVLAYVLSVDADAGHEAHAVDMSAADTGSQSPDATDDEAMPGLPLPLPPPPSADDATPTAEPVMTAAGASFARQPASLAAPPAPARPQPHGQTLAGSANSSHTGANPTSSGTHAGARHPGDRH